MYKDIKDKLFAFWKVNSHFHIPDKNNMRPQTREISETIAYFRGCKWFVGGVYRPGSLWMRWKSFVRKKREVGAILNLIVFHSHECWFPWTCPEMGRRWRELETWRREVVISVNQVFAEPIRRRIVLSDRSRICRPLSYSFSLHQESHCTWVTPDYL